MHGFISSITGLAAGAALVGHAAGINLNVHTSGGNATSPFMYGFMFEVSLARALSLNKALTVRSGHQPFW